MTQIVSLLKGEATLLLSKKQPTQPPLSQTTTTITTITTLHTSTSNHNQNNKNKTPKLLFRAKPPKHITTNPSSPQSSYLFSFPLQVHGLEAAVADGDYHHKGNCFSDEESVFPHVQMLRSFPKDELMEKVVMVRFDSSVLLRKGLNGASRSYHGAVFTIKYLHEAGAKLVLVSDWRSNSMLLDMDSVADTLSSILQHKVVAIRCISDGLPLQMEILEKADMILLDNLSELKEEVANCPKFARVLSSGVDIFVNDSFLDSHKVLASTVGITRFCHTCVAGFHFEETLHKLKKITLGNKSPYIAIIGGGNLYDKAAAVRFLASTCDGLVFVGMISFQIMHALGHSIPSNLVELGAHRTALEIIQVARNRKIPLLCPKDFWCVDNHLSGLMELVPTDGIRDGLVPVDIGPRSLEDMKSLLANCKKTMWIGLVKFKLPYQGATGDSNLARLLVELCERHAEVTVVGNMACEVMMTEASSQMVYDMIESASFVWEVFKGRKLPGLLALDRAYPFEIDWNAAYSDPAQPLVVDIGSGNGMFLLGMARRRKDINFLGLEINEKLVRRCLDSVRQSDIKNGHFIATNATSAFRSIVTNYPGELVLVTIQCPNPYFNDPENRWRMVQRSLVEAVVNLLALNGKIFLQSDVEAVSVRMRELFLKHSKGKLKFVCDLHDMKTDQGSWLEENPFGVRSDWERHVLSRGAPMYRLMLSKSPGVNQ